MNYNYYIYKMNEPGEKNGYTVSFSPLMNPTNTALPIMIEAGTPQEAAKKAMHILDLLAVETHMSLSDLGEYLGRLPMYFVGELLGEPAKTAYGSSAAVRIHEFTPVPPK